MRAALLIPVWTALALGAPAFGAGGGGEPLAVIANGDVPADELSLAELRKIFRGDRQFWSGDLRVVLLVPPAKSSERATLLDRVYGKTEAQYRQYWIARVFRTEAQSAPKPVRSESAPELVRQIPGAIAVVDAARAAPGVKVLRIDGKSAGDPGYPLR